MCILFLKGSIFIKIKRKKRKCIFFQEEKRIPVKKETSMCKWKKRNVKQIEFQHLPCEYFFDYSGFTITLHKKCES